MRAAWVALGLVTVSISGCLDPGPDGPTFEVAWSEKALPFGEDHDHEDRAQHRGLSTANFEVIGYDPLVSEHYGQPAGANFCGDAQPTADGRVLAVVESRSDVAFTLVDVTDPADPVWLGELVMSTTYVYDLAVVPDGRHVVLVTSDVVAPSPAAPLPGGGRAFDGLSWRSRCASEAVPLRWAVQEAPEDALPRPMSVLLVNIEDPAQPTIVDHQPLAGNGHSVMSTVIDGRTWVMITTTRYPRVDGAPATPPTPPVPGAPSANELSVYEFYELVEGPRGPQLNLLSVFKPPPGEDSPQLVGPRGHDGWLAIHPGTGQTLAYLVGHSRFTVVDLADSANPVEIGRWTEHGAGREGFSGALHSAYAVPELWDGRHYTIIGPEFGNHPEDHPSGIVWVLDTTDPTAPLEVAAWTLPHDAEWSGTYMFSNHYYGVHERTLLISMYHGGIWAVDLAPVGTADFVLLPSIGVYLPDIDPPQEVAVADRWAPTVEEALVLPDGTLITFDGNSGIYALRFDASRPAPAPEPWPIERP